MKMANRLLGFVDNLSEWTGRVAGFLMFTLAFIVGYEVVLRYVFDSPTIWAHETAAMFFGAFIMLGGAYTLRHQAHVNMDIIYGRLPARGKAILDIITFVLFFLFCWLLLRDGWNLAWKSLLANEHASTVWAPPVYPLRMMLPVGAFLILLQGLAKLARDVITASTGRVT